MAYCFNCNLGKPVDKKIPDKVYVRQAYYRGYIIWMPLCKKCKDLKKIG